MFNKYWQHKLQERVSSKLGERACDILTAYIESGRSMKEETLVSITNCSTSSSLGKLNVWTNELPTEVLSSASEFFTSVQVYNTHKT